MVYVIFPAYDEERAILPTLLALASAVRGREADYHAVLVDDGSTDRTVAEAERARLESGESLGLSVLRHPTNRGLGAALRTGITWCLDRAGDRDVIVTLDADGTHPPALIPSLVECTARGCDVAIASRYRPGAAVRGVPAHRRALSELARLVFGLVYPIPGVRDYTCGFRAYRAPLLRRAREVYGEALCSAAGFEAVTDLLLKLAPLGMRACEIGLPLDYSGRVGHSKMRIGSTIRNTLLLLARRRFERLTRRSPAASAITRPEPPAGSARR